MAAPLPSLYGISYKCKQKNNGSVLLLLNYKLKIIKIMIEKNNKQSDKVFLTVLADGKFHQQVEEGREGAIKREIKDKETSEVTDTKFELLHDSVKGIISEVTLVEGEYGKNLQITIDTEVISLGTKSSFGEDMLKKLPSIDLSKEVTLTPYSFLPKGEDTKKKGITVYQDGVKVGSYYYDAEKKESINGCPEPENGGKGFDSDDWSAHFNTVRKFMEKEIAKLPVFVEATKEEDKSLNKF